MARGDGIHRTNARNMRLTAARIGNAQQHNEREKGSYVNQDIVPERTRLNIHFKKPTAGYAEMFEQMKELAAILRKKRMKRGSIDFDFPETKVILDKNGKPTKWMVENSWGAGAGYQGHLIMTDEWFNEYTFRLVVETKYVTPKALEVLKQKPIRLPAWDPMFAGEE